MQITILVAYDWYTWWLKAISISGRYINGVDSGTSGTGSTANSIYGI